MTRNIRQNLSFLVDMINLLELDNFPRCQQPQKSESEWANSLSALRKTFKAKTLSRSSSSGGLASRTSHTLAKVPNSRTQRSAKCIHSFMHSHATPYKSSPNQRKGFKPTSPQRPHQFKIPNRQPSRLPTQLLIPRILLYLIRRQHVCLVAERRDEFLLLFDDIRIHGGGAGGRRPVVM